MCKSWGMARIINEKVRIIVQDGELVRVYETYQVAVSSTTAGLDYSLNLAQCKLTDTYVGKLVDDVEAFYNTPSVPAKKDTTFDAVIAAGKAQERAALEAARALQIAQDEAKEDLADANHRLHTAILDLIHKGKDSDEIVKALEAAGMHAFDTHVDRVTTFDTGEMYGVAPGMLFN